MRTSHYPELQDANIVEDFKPLSLDGQLQNTFGNLYKHRIYYRATCEITGTIEADSMINGLQLAAELSIKLRGLDTLGLDINAIPRTVNFVKVAMPVLSKVDPPMKKLQQHITKIVEYRTMDSKKIAGTSFALVVPQAFDAKVRDLTGSSYLGHKDVLQQLCPEQDAICPLPDLY